MGAAARRCSALAVAALVWAVMWAGMAAAAVYEVGDKLGWTIMGNPDYGRWAASKKFNVGDTIVFTYNKQFHNVIAVSKADYKNCDVTKPTATWATGKDSVVLNTTGHWQGLRRPQHYRPPLLPLRLPGPLRHWAEGRRPRALLCCPFHGTLDGARARPVRRRWWLRRPSRRRGALATRQCSVDGQLLLRRDDCRVRALHRRCRPKPALVRTFGCRAWVAGCEL